MSSREDYRRWADHSIGRAESSSAHLGQIWALIAIAQAILALGGDDEPQPAEPNPHGYTGKEF